MCPDRDDETVHRDRGRAVAASLRIARSPEKLLERGPVAVGESGIAPGTREEVAERERTPGGEHERQGGEAQRHPPRAPRRASPRLTNHPEAASLSTAPAVASATRAMNSKSSVSIRSLHR